MGRLFLSLYSAKLNKDQLEVCSFSLVVNLCTSFPLAFILYSLPTFLFCFQKIFGTPCPNSSLYRQGNRKISLGQRCRALAKAVIHWFIQQILIESLLKSRHVPSSGTVMNKSGLVPACGAYMRDTKQITTEVNTLNITNICYEGKYRILWGLVMIEGGQGRSAWEGKVLL